MIEGWEKVPPNVKLFVQAASALFIWVAFGISCAAMSPEEMPWYFAIGTVLLWIWAAAAGILGVIFTVIEDAESDE